MPHDAEFARNAWGGDALDDRLLISLRESNGNRRADHHDGRSRRELSRTGSLP
jgi:hypothetical protein